MSQLISNEELRKQLAAIAAEQSQDEKSSTNNISIKGKRFSIAGEKIGTQMDAVVVASAYENVYYDSPYDPDNIESPACFAVQQLTEDGMKPHPKAPRPQANSCAECPFNQWGSAKVGKGKACKNNRRLLLMPYNDATGVQVDQIATLKIPPMSIKSWSNYVKVLASRFKIPYFAAATTFTIDDDYDYPVLNMKLNTLIDDSSILQELIDRQEEFSSIILEPYDGIATNQDAKAVPNQASASRRSKMS